MRHQVVGVGETSVRRLGIVRSPDTLSEADRPLWPGDPAANCAMRVVGLQVVILSSTS